MKFTGVISAGAITLAMTAGAAFAGPEGAGRPPGSFAPWSEDTAYLQWPAQEPPYRIAIVNGFIGNTWRIQMIKTGGGSRRRSSSPNG